MKKNIIIAKIFVFILIVFTIILSLLKLTDTLSQPSIRLKSVITSVIEDSNVFTNYLENTNIYKAFNYNSYEINSNTSLTVKDLNDLDILNTTNFTTNISVDKQNNYLSMNIQGLKDNVNYNLEYIENKTDKYVKAPNKEYLLLSQFTSNYKILKPSIYSNILELILTDLNNIIKDEDVTSKKSAIGVNGRTIDVYTSNITFDGNTLKEYSNIVITNILNNQEILNYLNTFYGTDTSNTKLKLIEFVNGLNISNNKEYTLKAHLSNDKLIPLRLELTDTDDNALFSYTMTESNYHLLEYNKKSYELTIQDNRYELVITDNKNELTFTNNLDKNIGKLNLKDKVTLDYSYTKNNNIINLNMTIKPIYISSDAKITLFQTITISPNVTINKQYISNYDKEIDLNKDIFDYIDTYLQDYKDYYNSQKSTNYVEEITDNSENY